jgi:hypothetical protein
MAVIANVKQDRFGVAGRVSKGLKELAGLKHLITTVRGADHERVVSGCGSASSNSPRL